MQLDKKFFEARFYNTYYFANLVRNILHEQFNYIRNLDEFYGDDLYLNFVEPFPKHSVCHAFIEFLVEWVLFEDIEQVDLDQLREDERRFSCVPSMLEVFRQLPINRALDYYHIDHTTFDDWLTSESKCFNSADSIDVHDYFQDLRLQGAIDSLLEATAAEVFYVLFGNRGLMQLLNDMMASRISLTVIEEVPQEFRHYFKRDGVLDRSHIPAWVQKAVFFRDRGQCALCKADLSGLLNVSNSKNFDHIVPLSHGGLNDVTNIQLLCATCNSKKSDRSTDTSDFYEAWY